MMRGPGKNFLNYETKDINFPMLMILAGLLLVILGCVLLFGRVMDRFFNRYSPLTDKGTSGLIEMHRLPPEPRLQVDPPTDLIRLRDVEDVKLNNYSWIDPSAGKVRIPITRAMALVAQRERNHE